MIFQCEHKESIKDIHLSFENALAKSITHSCGDQYDNHIVQFRSHFLLHIRGVLEYQDKKSKIISKIIKKYYILLSET